jgi:hypothetical protein
MEALSAVPLQKLQHDEESMRRVAPEVSVQIAALDATALTSVLAKSSKV